ncbi:MAG: hypothetical protein H6765_01505 [Candidatus Peribacteria bacterium]|nr:MAG: hypothetical protein H6765_01505 [Candidatus Peribacteria bacterium]
MVIFIFLQDYSKLGFITMLATGVVVLILYVAGRFADQHKEDKVMAVNLSVQATNWIVGLSLAASSLFSGVAISIIEVFNKLTLQLS